MKNSFNKDTLKGLNHLLTRNKDAANGFVEVANNITYVNMTKWLIDWAKKHESNAKALESIIQEGDGDADASTSILGELHHAWIDIKSQLTNDDTSGLLNECIAGQEKALNDYDDIMSIDMPDMVKEIIKIQRVGISQSISELKSLKKNAEKIDA